MLDEAWFTWKRFGGYEVSTAGDSRFSALCATLSDGRTIEQHYQCDVKGFDPGGTNWRLGKGKAPRNRLGKDELWQKYVMLWMQWASMNKKLMLELR